MDWRLLLGAGAAVAAAAGYAYFTLRKGPPDTDEIERLRRSHLNQVGRIVEGHVVELVDVPPPPQAPTGGFFRRGLRSGGNGQTVRKLVCYSYSISGVTYETAQDITGLEARVHLDRLVAGQPASVKYDPSNPSNSILVADDWSGLH